MIDSQEPSLADASGSATMRVDLTGVRQGKRGRGRGGTSRHIQRDNATDTTVSTGNSRGRGRGQTHQSRPRLSEHSVTASEPSTAGEKGPIALTGPLSALKGNVSAEPTEDEAEICFICASDVVHNSIAPCNHRTCHICSLRMRALYKTKACPHCRVGRARVLSAIALLTINSWQRKQSSSLTVLTNATKNTIPQTLAVETRYWASTTRSQKSSKIQCFCFVIIVRMPIVM